MKKLFALLLALSLSFALVGCDNGEKWPRLANHFTVVSSGANEFEVEGGFVISAEKVSDTFFAIQYIISYTEKIGIFHCDSIEAVIAMPGNCEDDFFLSQSIDKLTGDEIVNMLNEEKGYNVLEEEVVLDEHNDYVSPFCTMTIKEHPIPTE